MGGLPVAVLALPEASFGSSVSPRAWSLMGNSVISTWMARECDIVPDHDEAPVVAHMKGREVVISVDIGLGRGKASVWTRDLTHGYIDINGAYRS